MNNIKKNKCIPTSYYNYVIFAFCVVFICQYLLNVVVMFIQYKP